MSVRVPFLSSFLYAFVFVTLYLYVFVYAYESVCAFECLCVILSEALYLFSVCIRKPVRVSVFVCVHFFTVFLYLCVST